MRTDSFAKMLIWEANKRGESYRWQQRVFKQCYGRSAQFQPDAEPMPPTLLFKLELKTLEAQKRVQEIESCAV
jgi:hypothetical protein